MLPSAATLFCVTLSSVLVGDSHALTIIAFNTVTKESAPVIPVKQPGSNPVRSGLHSQAVSINVHSSVASLYTT